MSREDFNQNSILVKDIMSKSLITVNPMTTSFQIAKMMERGGIGAIIVKESNHPVGIITDRDFATKIAANNLPLDTPVGKIMSSPLVIINHTATLASAANMMSSGKIRKLAVSNNDKIIGIITSTDLVNQLAK
ncbi:MAG: signal transduction protein [Thaumarchaeota archaeon]|nr:MAG: signal transduction protein [Nitrososphaerota archaeon]